MMPVGFEMKPIGDCVHEVSSWNPQRDGGNEEICYLDLSSVSQETKTVESHSRVLAADAPSRARQLVRSGDILVSTVRPNLNGVARVPDSFDGATASTGFCVLRPNESKMLGEYLLHWVKTPAFVLDMTRKATGASYPAVSDRIIHESLLPLPPLSEQQRIAAILDQAEALRAKRRQALAKLDNLTQSLFLDLFGKPGSTPKDGELVPFGSGPLQIIDGDRGKAYPTTDQFSPSGHCLFLTAKNVTSTGFDFSDCQFISDDRDRALGKGKLSRGDVVLTTRGTLGNTAFYGASVPFEHVRINSGMLILRTKGDLRAEFLYFFLGSPHFIRQMRRVQSGSAQPQLPVRTLNEMKLLLPPLSRQDECIKAFRLIEAHKQRLLRANDLHEKLCASLQHRAFRGEL